MELPQLVLAAGGLYEKYFTSHRYYLRAAYRNPVETVKLITEALPAIQAEALY
jgi:hypothetical protein